MSLAQKRSRENDINLIFVFVRSPIEIEMIKMYSMLEQIIDFNPINLDGHEDCGVCDFLLSLDTSIMLECAKWIRKSRDDKAYIKKIMQKLRAYLRVLNTCSSKDLFDELPIHSI